MSNAWDQEDEHRRADFEHMLDRVRRDHEDATLAAAETSLAGIPTSGVPMPNTAHPSLERHAAAVVSMGGSRPTVLLPRILPSSFAAVGEKPYLDFALSSPVVLTRKKCAGPAPFVGDPRWERAAYVWPVWVGDAGRWVAGDSELVWDYR